MAAFVTYLAPEGDEHEVTWLGYTFSDCEPVQVTNDALIEKARGNRFFDVEDVTEAREAVGVLEKRKPGRPRKVVAPESAPVDTDHAEVSP